MPTWFRAAHRRRDASGYSLACLRPYHPARWVLMPCTSASTSERWPIVLDWRRATWIPNGWIRSIKSSVDGACTQAPVCQIGQMVRNPAQDCRDRDNGRRRRDTPPALYSQNRGLSLSLQVRRPFLAVKVAMQLARCCRRSSTQATSRKSRRSAPAREKLRLVPMTGIRRSYPETG